MNSSSEPEKFNKEQMKNPCKYCLKKPVCDEICKDFKDYQAFTEVLWFTLLVIFLIFITIFIVLSFIKYNTIVYYVTLVILLITYISSLFTLQREQEFGSLNTLSKILIGISSPFGYAAYFIFEAFSIEKILEKFEYRYNKKLWNELCNLRKDNQ